jgi:hypothetical protein
MRDILIDADILNNDGEAMYGAAMASFYFDQSTNQPIKQSITFTVIFLATLRRIIIPLPNLATSAPMLLPTIYLMNRL